MRKLVITDNNNAHTGKTHALSLVYLLMKRKGYMVIPQEGPEEYGKDIRAIVNIDGHLVGIETMGDNTPEAAARHKQSMLEFDEAGCEVIITATRLQGKTREDVRELHQQKDYHAIWMKHDYTTMPELYDILNLRYAERVVRFVEEWLLGAKLNELDVRMWIDNAL